MVAVGIDGEAFARAFVMLELFPVRDIQSQVLTVIDVGSCGRSSPVALWSC